MRYNLFAAQFTLFSVQFDEFLTNVIVVLYHHQNQDTVTPRHPNSLMTVSVTPPSPPASGDTDLQFGLSQSPIKGITQHTVF